MPMIPLRALVIPFAAALMIVALAGQSAQSRLSNTGAMHADCKVAACDAGAVIIR